MQIERRHFLFRTLVAGLALSGVQGHAARRIAFGLTPVILDDQLGFLNDWMHWLEHSLHRDLRFVQRLKYQDITDGLLREQIDVAWICGLPYVRNRSHMELLAIPRYQGKLTYHSLIITGADFKNIKSIYDLRNRIFAFSDPNSNSGYLYPIYRLNSANLNSEGYFQRSFFTWSHRNTIDAVASGLADAGAVDSYIWEQYRRHYPEIVARTRIVERSPAFGFPPIVVRNDLAEPEKKSIGLSLTSMEKNPDGQALLQRLGLDGFAAPEETLYSGIQAMWQQVSHSMVSRETA